MFYYFINLIKWQQIMITMNEKWNYRNTDFKWRFQNQMIKLRRYIMFFSIHLKINRCFVASVPVFWDKYIWIVERGI